jgi:exosortase B
MSTVLGESEASGSRVRWLAWAIAAAGLAALYIPTYFSLAGTLWREEEYAHGPIILLVVAWLVWRERGVFTADAKPAPVAGGLLLLAGLVPYVLGRALALPLFEVASHLPVVAGVVLAIGGWPALRRLAFPLVFLVFVIPLPGFVLDWATTPLKTLATIVVTALLQAAGYPVERAGVVLDMGGHQMLVADACSGLNAIHSLFALGLLYAWLTPPRKALRIAVLLAAVIPIAVIANIVRVLILVLLAYHAGEEAAQGFLHGFAGIVLFLIAIGLLVAIDRWKADGRKAPGDARHEAGARPSVALAASAALLMIGAAIAVPAMKPAPSTDASLDLERMIPAQFGDWKIDPEIVPVAPTPDVQAKIDLIYRQVVSRTYVNSAGERMMLTVAYGGDQSDALKAHRQEKCYEAQGFEIAALERGTLAASGRTIPVTRMVAVRGERIEPVTYWFTMGDRVVLGRAERLRAQVEAGLGGRIPDGMLVRVSSLSSDAGAAFGAQQRFASAVFASVAPAEAARFIGGAKG